MVRVGGRGVGVGKGVGCKDLEEGVTIGIGCKIVNDVDVKDCTKFLMSTVGSTSLCRPGRGDIEPLCAMALSAIPFSFPLLPINRNAWH